MAQKILDIKKTYDKSQVGRGNAIFNIERDIFDDTEQSLGMSLNDELGLSLKSDASQDPLGCSLIASNDLFPSYMTHEIFESPKTYRDVTSTPRKGNDTLLDVFNFSSCTDVSSPIVDKSELVENHNEASSETKKNESEVDASQSLSSKEDIDVEQLQGYSYINNAKNKSKDENNSTARRKLFIKAMDEEKISKLITKKKIKSCCLQQCSKNLDNKFIRTCRYRLWTKNFRERITWFFDKLCEGFSENGKQYFVSDDGKILCASAFREIYYIDKNFYYRYYKKHRNGALAPGFCRRVSVKSQKNQAMNAWLTDYAIYYGDRMPDSLEMKLPHGTTKLSVYKKYKQEMNTKKMAFHSQAVFYSTWTNEFKHLKIKQANSFTKCCKCTSLERQIERSRVPEEREKLLQEFEKHNQKQMNERKAYYKKRQSAKLFPQSYLSLIVDGMDQAKTNIPHWLGSKSKNINAADLLKTHLTGVISHGSNQLYTFLDLCEYPHDPNLTINILLHTLNKLSAEMGNKLPATAYIQADNCWRENKNVTVMAFCELLVRKGIFKTVELSFLMVGHTHEDIDAAFSVIAEKLRTREAETLTELLGMLPNCLQLECVFDFRGWIQPYVNKITKHTKQLHFRFGTDSNGAIANSYKARNDCTWKNFQPLLKKVPIGIPDKVNPNYDNLNLEKKKRVLPQWASMFSDQATRVNFLWWQEFLQNVIDRKVTDSQWLLPLLPIFEAKQVDLPATITNLLAADEEEREVFVIQTKEKAPLKQIKRVKVRPGKKKGCVIQPKEKSPAKTPKNRPRTKKVSAVKQKKQNPRERIVAHVKKPVKSAKLKKLKKIAKDGRGTFKAQITNLETR